MFVYKLYSPVTQNSKFGFWLIWLTNTQVTNPKKQTKKTGHLPHFPQKMIFVTLFKQIALPIFSNIFFDQFTNNERL